MQNIALYIFAASFLVKCVRRKSGDTLPGNTDCRGRREQSVGKENGNFGAAGRSEPPVVFLQTNKRDFA
jgi:hypothetical protein